MKLQIASDIHLEHNPCTIPVLGDVVVLAGDLHAGCRGIEWAKRHFDGRPVCYVSGNHELYGHVYPDFIDEMRNAAAGSNVHFLEQDECILDGVRFLGATCWTDFTLLGYSRQADCADAAKDGLNDFVYIEKGGGHLLRPEDVAAVCRSTIAWLHERLTEKHDGPTVVILHHAPSIFCTEPKFRSNNMLAAAFCNNLEGMIREFQPTLVISGHTHFCCDFHIGSTRLVSNQRGYTDGEVPGFDPAFCVEV